MRKVMIPYLQQVIRFHRVVMCEVCGHVGAALERRRIAVTVQTVPLEQVRQLVLLHTKRVSGDKKAATGYL